MTDALEGLLDGLDRATVLTAMTPQLPNALVRGVLAVARRRGVHINLLVADLHGRWDFLDNAAEQQLLSGRLTVTVLAGAVPRRYAALVDHLPASLWEVDRLIASGQMDVDVFLARVGRVADGRATLGEMVGYTPAALDRARRIAFEVVSTPRSHPGAELELNRADVLVDGDPSEPASAGGAANAIQLRVAELAAGLVPDGATVQVGVGTVPARIAAKLAGRRHLGLHSGILPGAVQALLATGAVTGARKSRDPGWHVATGVLGGDPAAWGDRICLRPLSYTHDPQVLLTTEQLWALNSAYQVDLDGQVNAEYVDGLRRASGGGQLDFARAAHAGNGASVISLPARTADGRPRIVARLGCPITVTGADVDIVVTEYGIAHLAGRTAAQRAAALAAVAHPDDRPGLLR